ncbi:MAG: helix-turn-helix domain-containing protein [Motiliproteus sp.]
MDTPSPCDIDPLLDELRSKYQQARKEASLASQGAELHPIEEVGKQIRLNRKKQGLTQSELCDLSGLAYGTLNKIEHGHPSVRLDMLVSVARSLGMKLWIG